MGKRSEFERVEKDYYPTIDDRAIKSLIPHLSHLRTYAEPCFGGGHLVQMITKLTHLECVAFSDITSGTDALTIDVDYMNNADCIITNPVWSRSLLHKMILHFKDIAPTWLLFDADWAHTKQSIPYMQYCTDIVSVGRLIWIEGTKMTGKDNCAWYRFDKESKGITFHPKTY